MKNKLSCIIAISCIFCFSGLYGQEPAEIEGAFKSAIKSLEREKAEQQKQLVSLLRKKLSAALQQWISEAKAKKETQLNRLIEQGWHKLPGALSPVYYDYYLRNYEYIFNESDIIETASIISPYKAYANITEKLYVARKYPPGTSFLEHFLYTASRPVTLNFDYDNEEFRIVDVKYGGFSLEKGWPAGVRRPAY